jgi:hypothetical protein
MIGSSCTASLTKRSRKTKTKAQNSLTMLLFYTQEKVTKKKS